MSPNTEAIAYAMSVSTPVRVLLSVAKKVSGAVLPLELPISRVPRDRMAAGTSAAMEATLGAE
ncbi:hypothetical protein ADL28_29595 [Streptomyces violaceusniger]|uniref:Uncharacterized protein n=1 Tax=Streptomyces violaceusniger TaxID=68280 RepID=A0A0X3VUS7_STRVO|nr:hypothetical protein ADL28_29595 [Streptomyces violaceusniger]